MANPNPAVKQSDEELITAFQQGHLEAFNILVGRHKNQLMNYLFRYLGDYDQADDVLQETFIRVYRKKEFYKPIAKFTTWLYTIATNLAKTQISRRKRYLFFSKSKRNETRPEEAFDIPDQHASTDTLADSMLKQKIIQEALDSISPKYREVVILCDVQELSYEEICKITGLNIGTVKSRLNRGREKLKVLLKDIVDELR